MAANYLSCDPQQMMLLPESLQEWLPAMQPQPNQYQTVCRPRS
jgi:hypothetical protein